MSESVGEPEYVRSVCGHCGRQHGALPLSFAAAYPDAYAMLPAAERKQRSVVTSDQCIIDGREYYLRGCLEIPILGGREVFLWGVWARVHETDFDTIDGYWETEGRERAIGPFKGRLANALDLYPDSLDIRLEIRIQPAGIRPLFMLEEPNHPFTIEQRVGVSPDRAQEYACWLMTMAAHEHGPESVHE